MKKSIYIGMCQEGSTSLMRYKSLVAILEKSHEIDLVNIQPQIDSTKRIFRSIGWRYKIGPLINKINSFISKSLLETKEFDFVWIDKGVFIHPDVLKSLKAKTNKLIHFTPDPAFYYHRSTLFYKGLPLYTHVITTKSFEMELYKSRTDAELLFCTQGYDGLKHFPMVTFDNKKYDFSFIGHYESNRAKIVKALLNSGRSITLAGPKWRFFII